MFMPEVPEQHIPGIQEDNCSREHAALRHECWTTHVVRTKCQHVRENQSHWHRNHISSLQGQRWQQILTLKKYKINEGDGKKKILID